MTREEVYEAILKALRESCGCPLDEAHARLATDAVVEEMK